MKTISAEQFKKQYGNFGQPEKKPGYFQRVGQGLKQTFTGLKSDLGTQAETIAGESLQEDPSRIKQAVALGRGGLRTVGATAQAVFTPVMEAPGIKQATEFVGEKISDTAPVQKFQEWSERHPEAAKDIMNTLDIASLFPAAKGGAIAARGAVQATKTGAEVATKSAQAGLQAGKQLATTGKAALAPKPPSALEAVKQVIQGKAKDVAAGVKGLKEVSTEGVTKYSQLSTKVDDAIKNLSKKVDETLDDVTPVKLNKLSLSGATTAGKKVVVDYVSRGLGHLKEVYKAIGDDISSKNIDELVKKAKSIGLTRKEVNDLARTYGMEFGEKAFGKTGEALTSVNAKMFENTRKALKIVARQGMKGSKAEAIDKSISALFRVKKLVANNAEAVNKLAQKIQERGLLERFGYQAAKVTDILTGGTLRGIMGGLLPRGVGYKVMNALDLEKVLERNLKIITKALEAGDEELIKLLK